MILCLERNSLQATSVMPGSDEEYRHDLPKYVYFRAIAQKAAHFALPSYSTKFIVLERLYSYQFVFCGIELPLC